MKSFFLFFLTSVGIAFASLNPCQTCNDCSYDPGFRLPCNCCYSAYNIPAEIKVGPCWEVFTSGSFIYWFAGEETLDLGISAAYTTSTGATVVPNSVVLLQDFNYRPGFKVALGIDTNYDDWVCAADYTWVRHSSSITSAAPYQTIGLGVWFLSNWFIQPTMTGQTISAVQVNSKWDVDLDWMNAYISRPYYQGRNLTIAPFAGLTCTLIRQTLNLGVISPEVTTPEVQSHNHSKSWGVGPRGGVKANWLLGCGFRIESDAALDVLYTRYTKIYHEEDSLTNNGIPVSCEFGTYDCLRAVTEAGMGLGWGSYFGCNQYAVDLLLTYDFSIFWNQNMMRRLVDLNTLQQNASAANLYFHGLTATLRFDY